jgi:hypothetical protein
VAGRYNEGKAIDAVIRRIEERDRCSRQDDGWSPDDLGDPDPERRVDYVCTVGDRLYAFEHTGIEPFGNQIEMEVRNRTLFEPIIERFSKRSDGEFWELYFPIDASLRLRGRKVKQVSDALSRWIERNAANIRLARYGDRLTRPLLSETAAGIPFPFSLHRWSLKGLVPHGASPLSNCFGVRPFVVQYALDSARPIRLQKACEDKFPKLASWKQTHGARTVLVLEDNDISTTNEQVVTDTLLHVIQYMPHVADEIFMVNTCIANTWWVSCLRREEKTYYDEGERFHQVDPATLVGLTKRS